MYASRPHSSGRTSALRSNPATSQGDKRVAALAAASMGGKAASLPFQKQSASTPIQQEYIQNLQQQIYLLELENRYLRPKNGGSTANPEDEVKKRLEEQKNQMHIKLAEVEKDVARLKVSLESSAKEMAKLNSEKDETEQSLISLKEKYTTEKEKWCGEVGMLKKKQETHLMDISRLEGSYHRLVHEKERLQAALADVNLDSNKRKDQLKDSELRNGGLKKEIAELQQKLQLNATDLYNTKNELSSLSVETVNNQIYDLQREKIALLGSLQQAESMRDQEISFRARIAEDCQKLNNLNATLKTELESLKKENKVLERSDIVSKLHGCEKMVGSLQDEVTQLKESIETKEKKIHDLSSLIRKLELDVSGLQEEKVYFEETKGVLSNRISEQDQELTLLIQDKSQLIDELADLKNAHELKSRKNALMEDEIKEIRGKLDHYVKKTIVATELSSMLVQLESSGEKYLNLVKSVQGFLVSKAGPLSNTPSSISRNSILQHFTASLSSFHFTLLEMANKNPLIKGLAFAGALTINLFKGTRILMANNKQYNSLMRKYNWNSKALDVRSELVSKEYGLPSRKEVSFLIQHQRDIRKLGPLLITAFVGIIPEILPLLVAFNPKLLPSTIQLPPWKSTSTSNPAIPLSLILRIEISEKALKELAMPPSVFLALLADPGAAPNVFSIDQCTPQQLEMYCNYFGLLKWQPGVIQSYARKLFRLGPSVSPGFAGFWLARRRRRALALYLAEVRADDVYLAHELDDLSHEAVVNACEERGILTQLPSHLSEDTPSSDPILSRSMEELRVELESWVKLSIQSQPKAADLQLVIRMLIKNALWLKQKQLQKESIDNQFQ